MSRSYLKYFQEYDNDNNKQTHIFIENKFVPIGYRIVNISNLYVGIIYPDLTKNFVKITKTPHYQFAMNILHGHTVVPVSGYQDYEHYVELNWHPCDSASFVKLIRSIQEEGYDADNRPILVAKSLWRPLPVNRLDVIDGFHRLAVLAALGTKKFKVLKMRNRVSGFRRLLHRIYRAV